MTERTSPPFRADHVGSLLRPPEVKAARERFASGAISAPELRAVEDEAIRAAVAMQEQVGLKLATDGEIRRQSWHMDFIYSLAGIVHAPTDVQAVEFHTLDGDTIISAQGSLRVEGPVSLEHTIFGEDFETLAAMTTTAVPKQTIPSVNMIYARGGRAAIDEAAYPDLEQFWADLVTAYGQELVRLGELGCTYLQLDDTSLASINDPQQRAKIAARGDDADTMHLTFIRRLNDVIAQKPAGMAITTHMCRGNYRSSYSAEGSYDFVAEALFSELAVDGFFVEYDDERSGGFEPLRFVPKGKMVVLGLVTTKRGELETKDELKRRIEEASAYVPVEQLCLSPQCGFASTLEGNDLSYDEQVEKLRLVVETAQEVWC
ncbi:MAG TPA: 5-methyltetrahydropteroyltriglutamate--homocysteine S-methyltransferase [Solirubrobacteraceae bacterium]|nr:5-methyltetrahydropteroyltriglutamate--homocysteine S-methyltransferase [Solirubrobacteraceae bacterium]